MGSMTMRRGAGGFAALALGLAAGGAAGQTLPAEVPPLGYAQSSYVDSAGCAFVRVDLGGQSVWAAQIGADQQPICGLTPTLQRSAGPPVVTAPSTSPLIQPTPLIGRAPAADRPAAESPAGESATAESATPEKPPAESPAVESAAEKSAAESPAEPARAAEAPAPQPAAPVATAPAAPAAEAPAPQTAAPVATATAPRAEPLAESAPALPPAGTVPQRPVREITNRTLPEPGIYVQVGAFAQQRNADRTAAALQAQGWDVVNRVTRRLDIIYAGPFATEEEARAARRIVRRLGAPDAFLVRQE